MVAQPANFGGGIAREDGVAHFVGAALGAAEGTGNFIALAGDGRVAPEFDGCQHFSVRINRCKAMLLPLDSMDRVSVS